MTRTNFSLVSWQHIWMFYLVCAISFIGQGVVYGWIFPKPQAKVTIPLDFPLRYPFYRIAVFPEFTDDSNSLEVIFDVIRIRTHAGNDTDSRPIRVKPLVEVDKKNGSMWLIRNPTDVKLFENSHQNKQQYHLMVNITVSGKSESKKFVKKTEIILKLKGLMSDFCKISQLTCFTNSHNRYHIPEGSPENAVLDYLQNPSSSMFCSNGSFSYSITSGENYVHVTEHTGVLTILSDIDAERTNYFNFKVSCAFNNKTFFSDGYVEVMDLDDNAPTMQDGNISKTEIRFLKPGENWASFEVSVIDNDTKDVNDLVVRIVDDDLNLFKARNIKIYELLNSGRNTYFHAEIAPQKALSFPGEEYNFSVVIEDKSYLYENGTVRFGFSLINRTEQELPFKDIYYLNISRKAAKYARVMQFTKNNFSRRFKFSIGSKPHDWLGITQHTGIVYVRDPDFMISGLERRRVVWTSKNETNDESGSVLLIITVEETPQANCAPGMWCSFYTKQESCTHTCGEGSLSGVCAWRAGALTNSGLRPDYSTCSPDLTYCPDAHCDELEQLEPTLCPQDCARQITGEATMHANGQGIFVAVGPCTCHTTDRCKCVRDYPPPQEMRRAKMIRKPKVTSTPPTLDVNGSFVGDGIVMDSETSTTIEIIAPLTGPFIDGTCGPACILIASMVPFGLLLFIVVLILVRKLRTTSIAKHKFVGGSHISLSAVPSDYVEERSNSIPDARNTPSETASFGKATIDSKWDFPKSRLQLVSALGEGEFGKVMKAEAWNIAGNKGYTTVAVKMLKENGGTAERQDLFSEFLLLKEISHPNVVKLLGASLDKNGDFFLIVEYAELGSLRNYLRKKRRHNSCCRYNNTLPTKQDAPSMSRDYYQFPCERSKHEPKHSYFHKEQLSFAWQIAKGMAYLADLKLVHRDLAARNVLLAKRKVVKISDFGLSRDVYEGETYLKRSKGKVPIKWMAIESLEDQIYTTRSDVWSFGVVLWEILMNGATPYPGVTPQRLYNLLKAGYRMTKPDYCPDEVYALMRQCWKALPRERPSFKEIVLKLDFLLQDTVEYMDFVPKHKARLLTPEEILPTPNVSEPSVQYTAVLLEDDEEDVIGGECNESIGLVNLFEQYM